MRKEVQKQGAHPFRELRKVRVLLLTAQMNRLWDNRLSQEQIAGFPASSNKLSRSPVNGSTSRLY